MKNIKTFEELNHSTYMSAAKKIGELGQKNKADSIYNHADKIAKMGIQHMKFNISVGAKNIENAKFDSMSVYKSGNGYVLQTVFKSGESNVHRVNSSVLANGNITWRDGNKFGDRKSVVTFQKLIHEVSRFQQDFIKFFSDTGLTSEDLSLVPRTFYE